MPPSYVIGNARIVDPGRGTDCLGELLIANGRIAASRDELDSGKVNQIDATGCIATPGLIDFHAHLARWQTDTGVNPDLMAIPNGITAAVDAGSTGTAGAEGFIRHVIPNSEITIRMFVNVSAIGVATELHKENPNPSLYDEAALADLCDRFPDLVLGLKIRLGKSFSDGWGAASLDRAKEIARKIGKPLCVHATNPEISYDRLLGVMERGDILCHCYQGGDHTILADDGRVAKALSKARERGVLFDAAVGRINYDLEVAAKALADGFPPDIVSTDVVSTSLYHPKLFHLLRVASLFLALGMPLDQVIRACTDTPARLMGMEGEIGALTPGARADVAIFAVREKPVHFSDARGHTINDDRLLIPQATFKNGRLLYKQIDFEY